MTALHIAGGCVLAAIALTGAYLDSRYRRLPNWLCLLALPAGLVFTFASFGWEAAGFALAHSLLALCVGAGLFALGGIGGGDAKYYAALAAWFPLQAGANLLVSVALSGLVLTIVWMLIRRRVLRAHVDLPAESEFRKLPYGVAIASGALASYAIQIYAY